MHPLVWINGPFGVGKTQTANALHARIAGSAVVDPEEIGFGIRRSMPRSAWPADFQELPQWRLAVREHLAWISKNLPGPVFVPMTLLEPAWHEEIVGGLRARGVPLEHVTLTARADTVRARLRGRGDGGNR